MCDEMKKLRKWLDDNGIEWVDKSSEETLISHYMCRTGFYYDNEWASVISGSYSYGGKEGLLEMFIVKFLLKTM